MDDCYFPNRISSDIRPSTEPNVAHTEHFGYCKISKAMAHLNDLCSSYINTNFAEDLATEIVRAVSFLLSLFLMYQYLSHRIPV